MNEPARPDNDAELDSVILNEIQLLLSEKRTSLSTLRTGISIFAFPLSVLSVLIATSRSYDVKDVVHLLVPLILLNLALTGLGIYLTVHAVQRIHHYNRLIDEFKRRYGRLAKLLD
jgi:hypothetical protein